MACSRAGCASLALLAIALAPARASANCAPAALPAAVEWAWWIGAGGGARDLARPGERAVPELTIGGGVTFQVMSFFGA